MSSNPLWLNTSGARQYAPNGTKSSGQKLYLNSFCELCKQYCPDKSSWAVMQPRKAKADTWLKHENSAVHRLANSLASPLLGQEDGNDEWVDCNDNDSDSESSLESSIVLL